MNTRVALFILAAMVAAGQAPAQRTTRDHLKDFLSADENVKEAAILELFGEGLLRAVNEKTQQKRLEGTIEARRIDKQLAGEAGNSGTTSLVALAGATQFLSAALESGVLSQTGDSSVATFRLNASALAKLLYPQKPCYLFREGCKPTLEQRLKGLSFAASFDQAKAEGGTVSGTVVTEGSGGATTATNAATTLAALQKSRELRSFSAKWELRRRKSLSDRTIEASWRKAMQAVRASANSVGTAANAVIASDPADKERRREARNKAVARLEAIASGSFSADEKLRLMETAYEAEMEAMVNTVSAEKAARITDLFGSLATFRAERNQILHDVLYPVGVSVDYVYQKPAMQADYSQFRVAITKPFGATKEEAATGADPSGQFTANFGASFYHSPVAGMNSFRDFRGGMQLDRKFAWQYSEAKPVFSLAGYGQYQAEKGLLEFDQNEFTPIGGIPIPKPAKLLLDTKGAIFIAQAKLVIPLGDKGVNFPIAISWANRTELIKATEVKWQFGFTFDLDKLKALGGGK